jgi:hypothetical protein
MTTSEKQRHNSGTPTLAPESRTEEGKQQSGESRPEDFTSESVAAQAGQAQDQPTQTPPGATATVSGSAGAVTGTWIANVMVDALWSANETRNGFFHTPAQGWQKIFNGSDSAYTNLTALAAQAHQSAHAISYRVEADGLVHEIYLW